MPLRRGTVITSMLSLFVPHGGRRARALAFILFGLALPTFSVRVAAQIPGAAQYAVLHSFTAAEGRGPQDGVVLAQAATGHLFGVRVLGGSSDRGTLFRIGADGTGFTVLKHFNTAEGASPSAVLAHRDGRVYGTTYVDGPGRYGTVFAINADGTGFTTLHVFDGTAVAYLPTSLVVGADGLLYGACLVGGTSPGNAATGIFRLATDGSAFRVLRTLNRATEGGGLHGSPGVTLTPAADGSFYGAALGGGANDYGTLFHLTSEGGLTVLRHMAYVDGRRPNRLVLTRNGRLFGTTFDGVNGDGGVFRMAPDGSGFEVVTRVHLSYPPPTMGFSVKAGLTEGADGLLYGVSQGGGDTRGLGTLFRIDPRDGSYRLLRMFAPLDGVIPLGDLLPGSNGRFYGLTAIAGGGGEGTIFSYAVATAGTRAATAVGQPFAYPGAALVGVAGAYTATDLPSGLSINATTGDITGTPRQSGSFQIQVRADRPATTTAALTLEVAKGPARVTISNLSHEYDGTPKRVTVTTEPTGLSVTIVYDGLLTPPNRPGNYTVVALVTDPNYDGNATATMTIGGAAPTITIPAAPSAVIAGNDVTIRANVLGAGVALQWQRKAAGAETFVDLTEGDGFRGVLTGTLVIVAPTFAMNGDEFRLVARNSLGTTTGEAVRLVVYPSAMLANVAVRARLRPGEPLSVGFVTTRDRPLLVRAVGPGLATFLGASAVAGDPRLVVANTQNVPLAANDDWGGGTALIATFASVGAFALPPASLDAATLVNVNGAATAQMSVAGAGIGLIEVYDTGSDPAGRIVNLSALHQAGVEGDALTAGFLVAGSGTKRLLVRGIGPALRSFGMTSALAHARIEVFAANGARLVTSEEWTPSVAAAFGQAGAFALPPGSKDAALVLHAVPGSYTVRLSSVDGVAGAGLVEIYELP